MKRVILSLLAGVVIACAPVAKAENISVDSLKDAAAHYLQHNTSFVDVQASQLKIAKQWNNTELQLPTMYLFTTPSEGWIIMTAESAADPVVAYSDDSYFNSEKMPESLEWWLDNYNTLICEIQKYAATHRMADHPEWAVLFKHGLKGNTKASNVILMQERWNQGGVDGSDYNMYSPVINDTVCPSGCVATAMAQIMHYYKFPKKPTGGVNYTVQANGQKIVAKLSDSAALDYTLMPNRIISSTPVEQRREISRLHYYAGIAVQMQYSPDGSGAMSTNVANSMRNRFKYTMGKMTYRSTVADSVYLKTLRDELIAGHPVYMGGSSSTGSDVHSAGHAWVCAGYRENNEKMYYMNWGWGGSGNGYYNLYDNDMPITSMGYNFNRYQEIITNMVPPADSIVSISQVENPVIMGKAYPNPATSAISIPYSTRQAADLCIYSADGRMVLSQHVQPGDGEVRLEINAMPAGIYIYRMGGAYGKFVVTR